MLLGPQDEQVPSGDRIIIVVAFIFGGCVAILAGETVKDPVSVVAVDTVKPPLTDNEAVGAVVPIPTLLLVESTYKVFVSTVKSLATVVPLAVKVADNVGTIDPLALVLKVIDIGALPVAGAVNVLKSICPPSSKPDPVYISCRILPCSCVAFGISGVPLVPAEDLNLICPFGVLDLYDSSIN